MVRFTKINGGKDMVKIDDDLVKSFEELVKKTNSLLEDLKKTEDMKNFMERNGRPDFLNPIEAERFKGKDDDEDDKSMYIRANESEEIVNWLERVSVVVFGCSEAKQFLERSTNIIRKWMLFDTALRGEKSKFYAELFSVGD